jgi:hypothetical protein
VIIFCIALALLKLMPNAKLYASTSSVPLSKPEKSKSKSILSFELPVKSIYQEHNEDFGKLLMLKASFSLV